MKCLLCGSEIPQRLTLREIIFLKPLPRPTLCPSCRQRFSKMVVTAACPNCGRDHCGGRQCEDCQGWQHRLGWTVENHPLYHYHGAMADFMVAYKFHGDYRLREVFSPLFSKTVQDLASAVGASAVVPIPVTAHTMATRGFNQVLGLLSHYDQSARAKIKPWLEHKNSVKKPQSKKRRAARLASPQPFQLSSEAAVEGQTIIIVDDVYTTGRTLYHAAQLFKDAGATRIVSVTLAA